jgi:hypothetical protein
MLTLFMLAGCGSKPSINTGTVSDASAGSEPPAAAETTTTSAAPKKKTLPTWGNRYTWPDGIAVELAQPVACKPSAEASTLEDDNVAGKRGIKVQVTIINGSDDPLDTLFVDVSGAQFNGRTAPKIYDIGGGCAADIDSTTILPGKTFTGAVAFAVDPNPGELQLTVREQLGGDKAVFVGQA